MANVYYLYIYTEGSTDSLLQVRDEREKGKQKGEEPRILFWAVMPAAVSFQMDRSLWGGGGGGGGGGRGEGKGRAEEGGELTWSLNVPKTRKIPSIHMEILPCRILSGAVHIRATYWRHVRVLAPRGGLGSVSMALRLSLLQTSTLRRRVRVAAWPQSHPGQPWTDKRQLDS